MRAFKGQKQSNNTAWRTSCGEKWVFIQPILPIYKIADN